MELYYYCYVYLDDTFNVQEEKLVFSQSQESECNAKYNLDAVTQKTVHYPDDNRLLKCPMSNIIYHIFFCKYDNVSTKNKDEQKIPLASSITIMKRTEHILL